MTTSRREFQPGEMVPGTVYSVVRQLGAGGMGTVYDVEDTTIGKRYVLKTLHAQLGDRADLARRMQAEARALARLHHPNIVEVITAGMTADDLRLPYYVMERLNGQSLRYVLQKRQQLELGHAFQITIDLLDALDHAHEAGVVHRDVKPDNIFLHRTPAGVTVTKLLDFGIMSVLDGGVGETRGRFLGTLRYAAPEQIRGEKATPKVDLYAAALVLYEMLAGRGPFDDETEQQKIAAAHLNRMPPPLGQLATVPPGVAALVEAALAKDPGRRPRDAFTFASALRGLRRTTTPPVEATAGRETVPAVLSQAPLSERAIPHAPPAAGAPPRATTMMGMAPPTVSGATLENAPPSTNATLASGGARPIDRNAPTNTFSPANAYTPPRAAGDPLGATVPSKGVGPSTAAQMPVYVAPQPLPPPPAPFNWPAMGPEAKSDSAHSRSVAGAATAPPRKANAFAAVVSMALVGVAVVVSVVGWRMVRASHIAAAAAGASVGSTGSATSASPIDSAPLPPPPVVTMPTPTIAPPGLEDPGTSSVTPAASIVPSSRASMHKPGAFPGAAPVKLTATATAPQVVQPAPQPVQPAATPTAPVRPGPGF
jgi:eukaryotic-like serine/threonine-protein kinase